MVVRLAFMITPDEVGRRLRRRRRLLDLKQADVADRLGVHQNTVSNWEHGESLSLDRLLQVTEVLDMSLVDLLGDQDDVPAA